MKRIIPGFTACVMLPSGRSLAEQAGKLHEARTPVAGRCDKARDEALTATGGPVAAPGEVGGHLIVYRISMVETARCLAPTIAHCQTLAPLSDRAASAVEFNYRFSQ